MRKSSMAFWDRFKFPRRGSDEESNMTAADYFRPDWGWFRFSRHGSDEESDMAERKIWTAADYVRPDWDVDHLIEMLESRACGYDGILRSVLCSAARRLRDQGAALHEGADLLEETLEAVPAEVD